MRSTRFLGTSMLALLCAVLFNNHTKAERVTVTLPATCSRTALAVVQIGAAGGEPGCGDGLCTGDEHCTSCPVDCSECPTGACCLAASGAGCIVQAEADCTEAGGEYLGDFVECIFSKEVMASHPNVLIPLLDPEGISDTITVPDDGAILDVDIDLNITHSWVGALCVSVEHNGTSVTLIQRMGDPNLGCDLVGCCGCSEDNMDILLDDDATAPIEDQCESDLQGNYSPESPLAAFNGLSKAGDWTITVIDNDDSDVGWLVWWGLRIAGSNCDGSCSNCPTDANGDRETGPFDLAALLSEWGPVGGPAETGNCLDANSDGDMGPLDLATLLAAWGPCPE